MATKPGILFTAFEPSGDALAAAVVLQLKQRRPDLPIWAMGGQRVENAGAQMLESTTHHASMFLDSLKHMMSHRARLGRLKTWLREHDIAALVPTDSPAANWSICKLFRREKPEAKIVHLAAPQLWAWAPWRIGKMRYCTDHVLCLLPFEPGWFQQRGVAGTFVGHPLFEEKREVRPAAGDVTCIALLPGSRDSELRINWPTMREAFVQLKQRHGQLQGRIAALDDRIAAMLPKPLPDGVDVHIGKTDEVLAWSDLVLVASGTASLQVALHRKPMVVMYNVSWLGYQLAGRWLLTTHTLSLPNLISEWQSGRHVVPELMPHFGQVPPVVEAMDQLVSDPSARQEQLEALERVLEPFAQNRFGESAAARLLEVIEAG